MKEETFEGVAGLKIFTRSWRPAGTPRAAVVIVPGFNSHSGYYGWVAEQLVARNLAAHAIDLRGRGKSEGERFYVEKFADYVDDVARFVQIVKQREPGLPVYLLGHSAGGVISCIYTIEHQSEIAGFICESFAFQVPAPDIALSILKGLSHVAPHVHVLKLKNEDFSRDPKIVDTMNKDPLIANEVQPTQTVAEMVRADERLKKEFSKIHLPVLILHGSADKATKPSGSRLFDESVGSTDRTFKIYEGSFHDPLNDLDRQTVMNDILLWLDGRIAKA